MANITILPTPNYKNPIDNLSNKVLENINEDIQIDQKIKDYFNLNLSSSVLYYNEAGQLDVRISTGYLDSYRSGLIIAQSYLGNAICVNIDHSRGLGIDQQGIHLKIGTGLRFMGGCLVPDSTHTSGIFIGTSSNSQHSLNTLLFPQPLWSVASDGSVRPQVVITTKLNGDDSIGMHMSTLVINSNQLRLKRDGVYELVADSASVLVGTDSSFNISTLLLNTEHFNYNASDHKLNLKLQIKEINAQKQTNVLVGTLLIPEELLIQANDGLLLRSSGAVALGTDPNLTEIDDISVILLGDGLTRSSINRSQPTLQLNVNTNHFAFSKEVESWTNSKLTLAYPIINKINNSVTKDELDSIIEQKLKDHNLI